MITIKIILTPYLMEYLIGKYNGCDNSRPVKFPDSSDLYHYLYDLLIPRPDKCSIDKGNIEIVLPFRHEGKRPETYNYMSYDAIKVFTRRIYIAFNADLHDFINEKRHIEGLFIKDAIILFMAKFGISSINEDSIKKNYYRWRKKMQKKQKIFSR